MKSISLTKILLFVLSAAALAFVGFWGMLFIVLSGRPEVALPCLIVFLIALQLCLFTRFKKQTGIVMALAVLLGGGHFGYHAWQMEQAHKVPQMTADVDLDEYEPFAENNRLAKLDAPAALQIPADRRPRLDGAVALYPLYAAFVQAVYPPPAPENSWEYGWRNEGMVAMTNTPDAYERLIKGETDIIFVAEPSDAQVKAAAAAGKTFKLTPIGKEAFVFFVNKQNPVGNLSTEQVVGIYSGRLKNWREVGGPDQAIRAFQRNENSGSQTALQKIMGGTPLMEPPYEDRMQNMGGIVKGVADYRNYENALGFSFRYYTQTMLNNNQIKLLNINGIAPTRENIANNSYPYAKEFYAVTAGNETPAVKQFIEWIKSPQGRELINKTGYVAIDG
ncbi:PstS family phosphate ABC transporter substrate-binding protein [Neisseria sp.]|uniref:PstS family phosphate ABC transporter substrate-binding protein n=1 Tax=Neisseria sp. TaxID=192066 RepID=UPI0035A0DD7D